MPATIYIHGFTRSADADGELAPDFPARPTKPRAPALAPAPEDVVLQTLRESALPEIDDSLAAFASMTAPLIELARRGAKPDRIGIIVGTTTAGLGAVIERLRAASAGTPPAPEAWLPMAIGRMAEALAQAYGIGGPAYVMSTACTAGAKAIAEGARLLRSGQVDAVVAGGMDFLNDLTASGFAALGAVSPTEARPFAASRSGLRLGAGGGFVVMSRSPTLWAEGPASQLILAGWAETSDAHHISAPDPQGKEAERAMRLAIERAGFTPSMIDFAVLHGTATAQNDPMEAKAVHAVLGDKTPCASLKGVVGHQLAGAGAYGAVAALEMLARTNDEGSTPLPANFRAGESLDPKIADSSPIALTRADRPMRQAVGRVLVNAFAFGGSNAALVFASTAKTAPVAQIAEPPSSPALPADAARFLAQRAPMQMIDEALEVFEAGAASRTVIRADNLLCREDGRFPALGLIEVMAQTIGIYAGHRWLSSGKTPEAGLLLGTRKMMLAESDLPIGAELYCRVEKTFESDEGLWQFACVVWWTNAPDALHEPEAQSPHGRQIGSAMLTVFNPPPGYFENRQESAAKPNRQASS